MPLVWKGDPPALASQEEVRAYVGLDARGIDLGRCFAGPNAGRIIYSDVRHGFLFGPTGTGKTSAWLIRNLLGDTLADVSVVCTDPKGELAAVTAASRHRQGHHVRIIDPFGKLAELVRARPEDYAYLRENGLIESVGFSPLPTIDPMSPTFYDEAAALGEALIEIERHDSHWSQSAQGLITGLIMLEIAEAKQAGRTATFDNLRLWLTEKERMAGDAFEHTSTTDDESREAPDPDATAAAIDTVLADLLAQHRENGLDPATLFDMRAKMRPEKKRAVGKDLPISGLAGAATRAVAMAARFGRDPETKEKLPPGTPIPYSYDVIASLLGRFTRNTREIDSIKSVADTQTRWLLSRPLREDLGRPPRQGEQPFRFADLKRDRTTVYLIIPAERIRTYSAWLRMLIVSALRGLYTPGRNRTIFFLDEMPALGRLDPLTDAFAVVRAFKIQIVGIAQDLVQLKDLYKDRYESFIANAGFIQFFTPNDLTTAKFMSDRAGQKAIRVASVGQNEKPDTVEISPASESRHVSQQAIAAYTPQQLMSLERGHGLVFLSGLGKAAPVYTPHYKDVALAASRACPNPYDG